MLKVFVCDDDVFINEWFKLAVEDYSSSHSVNIELNTFTDVGGMIGAVEKGGKPDLIFLDVLFPEANGISSAKAIRDKIKNSRLVIMTSSKDYALDGYAVHAYDYLLKPLQKETVYRLFGDTPKQDGTRFEIRVKGAPVEISSTDLMYIESDRHTLIFHLCGTRFVIYGKLDDYAELLMRDSSFIRCHQSYLVNMNYITGMKGRIFLMKDGVDIPMRKKDAAEFKREYYAFVLNSSQPK